MEGGQAESFEWVGKDVLCIFVYIVSVVHAMQAGQMEKAAKYTDKGLSQLEKLKGGSGGSSELLASFHILLLENSAMQRLILGQPSVAIRDIYAICAAASAPEHPALFPAHEAQAHTLLGLYAMTLQETDTAVRQFNTALKVLPILAHPFLTRHRLSPFPRWQRMWISGAW